MRKNTSDLQREYTELKRELQNVGYILEGSLVKRMLTCGKPSCRCHEDPEKRHGPYYQLTWKRNGKTVSQFISEALALQYQEWIENRKQLSNTIKKMYILSRKAIEGISKESASKNDRCIVLIVNNTLKKK